MKYRNQMAAEVAAPFTDEQLHGETVSKKDIATFIQANASEQFLLNHKLKGAIKNVVKTKTKEQLVDDYKQLFTSKSFKTGDEEPPVSPTQTVAKDHAKGSATGAAKDVAKVTEKMKKLEAKAAEPVKFTKKIIKTGDKTTYPQKGEDVECYYTGKLADGKVFDTNVEDPKKGKKNNPLRFKLGAGKVIRGWDEALQTMTLGEKAEIVIQPEWAYGKKGLEGKIPPNSTLTFEVELVTIL